MISWALVAASSRTTRTRTELLPSANLLRSSRCQCRSPFSTEFTKEGVATFYAASHESLRQQHAQTFSAAVDFGDITAEERAARIQQQADAHEVEQILQSVTPCAWTSQTVVVPAWSEVRFKVRVPEILSKAREVAVVPLDDERREDLGVLIAPTLQNVGKDGTILLLAVNNDTKPKRIPMLTPLCTVHC